MKNIFTPKHSLFMKRLASIIVLLLTYSPLNALALFDECKEYFPKENIPTTTQTGRDLCFNSFAIFYSSEHKKPIYVVEKLNRTRLQAVRPKRSNQFYEEARLPYRERSQLSDYRGSGYDRGHNAPAADMTNNEAMAQSFSLANMMPQAKLNNQGIWAKNVERLTRRYAIKAQGNIFVFTGSIGNIGSIGKNKITIPSHLFKLVFDEDKNKAWAYWVENSDNASMTPPIDYEELKNRTGIDFHLGNPIK